jgi:hypothetical protein
VQCCGAMDEEEVCVAPEPWQETAPPYSSADPAQYPAESSPMEAGAGPEADAARAELYADQYGGVEVCTDPAQLSVIGPLGGRHMWMKTPNAEGGQGPADGATGLETEITNHKGRSEGESAECHPAEIAGYPIDQACVEERIKPGRDTGIWSPWNTCNDVVEDILYDCYVEPPGFVPPSTGGGGGPDALPSTGGGGAAGS